MLEDEANQSFGPELEEMVTEVEDQMAMQGAELGGGGLNLPDLMLETSQCCQFATRVSSLNIAGLGDLLDVVLSQEFGKCGSRILLLVWVSGNIISLSSAQDSACSVRECLVIIL